LRGQRLEELAVLLAVQRDEAVTIRTRVRTEGNEPTRPRKLPGPNRYGNIVLKWGITEASHKIALNKLFDGCEKACRRLITQYGVESSRKPAGRQTLVEDNRSRATSKAAR
jgi:hypothetical protein